MDGDFEVRLPFLPKFGTTFRWGCGGLSGDMNQGSGAL
jgi:hypothetical protein